MQTEIDTLETLSLLGLLGALLGLSVYASRVILINTYQAYRQWHKGLFIS